jgi:hypothetical protein
MLRGDYEIDIGTTLSLADLDAPCSVLEMLIALATRFAYLTFDPINGSEPKKVESFWELINNLKLSSFHTKNVGIINDFLERQYSSDGYGGLFPLEFPKEDQRHVEIWYQMMAYINEGLS